MAPAKGDSALLELLSIGLLEQVAANLQPEDRCGTARCGAGCSGPEQQGNSSGAAAAT